MAKFFTAVALLSGLLLSVGGVPAPRVPVAQSGSLDDGVVLRSTDNGLIGAIPSSHQSGGDDYIVLFNSSYPEFPHVADVLSRVELSADHSDVHHVYNGTVLRGFCASMKSHCIDALNAMGDVAYVEKVVTVSINAQSSRSNAPWGLQRISSPNQVTGDPLDLSYTYKFDNGNGLGSGVDVYVIDTGVNVQHAAFGGRAKLQSYIQSQDDDNGHGTHVSGTAAGEVFGVASDANIFGKKVLDETGTGTSATTLRAISDVIEQHNARKAEPGFKGSVINMSFNLARSAAMNSAIQTAMENGIHAVVAAGNEGMDSCKFSPSSIGGTGGNAISVGAVSIQNRLSTFSNTGQCVDVYAPGENIVSAWIGGDNVINAIDGTSMAAPHVTGLVAYHIARNESLAQDPAAMKAFVRASGFKGKIGGSFYQGDPVILVNNGFAS